MNRTKLYLGNDIFSIGHAGGNSSEVMMAKIKLAGVELADLYAYYQNNNFTFHDLQDLLPEFEYPVPEFIGYFKSNVDAIRKLDLNLTQDSGYIHNLSYYVLMNAGRSEMIKIGLDYSLRTPIPFLTNQPNFKKTTETSIEWLFLPLSFSAGTPGELHLKATAMDEEGNPTTVVLHSQLAVTNHSVLGVDASPYRVMPDLPAGTIAYYVQIFDENDEPVSESRYYRIVPDYEEDFTIAFRNSLGVWDTITLQGNQTRSIKQSSGILSSPERVKKYDSDHYRRITLRCSDLDVRWQQYLQELVISKEVLLLENGYHSLISESDDLTYLDTSKYTENMEFNFRFTANDRSY